MDGSSTSRIRQFGEFRRSIVDALERRLREIEGAMEAVRKTPGDAPLVAEAIRRLEELFGMAGPLGMAQVCRAASLFRSTVPSGGAPPADADRFESVLRACFEPNAGSAATSLIELRRVFMGSADLKMSALIVEALRPSSYDVVPFGDLNALAAALDVERPLAVLLGTSISPTPAFLDSLRTRGLPLFFLSKDGSLEARIAGIRAGARGFFAATDDAATLADGLDRLTLEPLSEPHRVMIVDDDLVAAALHATLLRRSGMTVETVTDPLRALDALLRFNADLLLLDIDLGPFTGDEFAAALRQHPAFIGIPIIFLSSEARPTFQFAARGAGAEDFLVKPVPPARLLAEVLLRAEHGRAIRTHLLFDPRTGALHPPAFLRRLRGEIDLARRRARPFCCARARIDGFASLDPAGGRAVLRRLHDLLRSRLRRTDVVGQSGPDGVAIVLLDIDAASAGRILEDIRVAFSESERATLSAGVAAFPAAPDAGLLMDAARTAQRRAVEAGGNRVVVLPSDSVV